MSSAGRSIVVTGGRFGTPMASVIMVKELLLMFGSGSENRTRAKKITVVVLLGTTVISIVASACASKDGMLLITSWPEIAVVPREALIDLITTLASSLFVICTPAAAVSPLFTTVTL